MQRERICSRLDALRAVGGDQACDEKRKALCTTQKSRPARKGVDLASSHQVATFARRRHSLRFDYMV